MVVHTLLMELQCHYCKAGRAILDEGDFICDNCGVVVEAPEEYTVSQPFYNNIATADTDIPEKYTSSSKLMHVEEEISGQRTIIRKGYVNKCRKYVDYDAVSIRSEQKNMIKLAICDICENLRLKPEKVLNKFEAYLKKVPINDTLKRDNIITNKRHKREPNVVAAGLIFKVYRNKITIRKLRKAAGCGNKSLQKVLRLIA